jgi:hypothetical protein
VWLVVGGVWRVVESALVGCRACDVHPVLVWWQNSFGPPCTNALP